VRDLSINSKRILTGCALILFLISIADLFLFKALFEYDKLICAIFGDILALSIRYIGPTPEEIRKYREENNRTPYEHV